MIGHEVGTWMWCDAFVRLTPQLGFWGHLASLFGWKSQSHGSRKISHIHELINAFEHHSQVVSCREREAYAKMVKQKDKEISDIGGEASAYLCQLDEAHDRIAGLEKSVDQAGKEVLELLKKNRELEDQPSSYARALDEANARIESLVQDGFELNESHEAMRVNLGYAENRYAEMEADLKGRISQLISANEILQSDMASLQDVHTKMCEYHEKAESYRRQLEILKMQIFGAKELLENTKESLNQMAAERDSFRAKLSAVADLDDRRLQTIASLESKLSGYRERIKMATEALEDTF